MWFLFSVFTGPIATIWLIFCLKEKTPSKNDRVYDYYKSVLLNKSYRVSDWNYINRMVEDLEKRKFNDDEILILSAYVNAELERNRGNFSALTLNVSIIVALCVGMLYSPLLDSDVDPKLLLLVLITVTTPIIYSSFKSSQYQFKHKRILFIKEALNIYRTKYCNDNITTNLS